MSSSIKKIILLMLVLGCVWYLVQPESSLKYTALMNANNNLEFESVEYITNWSEENINIVGDIRRVDRAKNKNIPILTYHWVVSTGDFSNPELVSLRHTGKGNYYYSSKQKVKGDIKFYHLITTSDQVQEKIKSIKEGQQINMVAKYSLNNKIEDPVSGWSIQINHSNHQFLLVDSIDFIEP